MSFVVQATQSQGEDARQLLKYLALKSQINAMSDTASKELNAELDLKMVPSSLEPTSKGDRMAQRSKALSNLRKMVSASVAFSVLNSLDKGGDLVGFNTFFSKFQNEYKDLQDTTPMLFMQLWRAFKNKVEAEIKDAGAVSLPYRDAPPAPSVVATPLPPMSVAGPSRVYSQFPPPAPPVRPAPAPVVLDAVFGKNDAEKVLEYINRLNYDLLSDDEKDRFVDSVISFVSHYDPNVGNDDIRDSLDKGGMSKLVNGIKSTIPPKVITQPSMSSNLAPVVSLPLTPSAPAALIPSSPSSPAGPMLDPQYGALYNRLIDVEYTISPDEGKEQIIAAFTKLLQAFDKTGPHFDVRAILDGGGQLALLSAIDFNGAERYIKNLTLNTLYDIEKAIDPSVKKSDVKERLERTSWTQSPPSSAPASPAKSPVKPVIYPRPELTPRTKAEMEKLKAALAPAPTKADDTNEIEQNVEEAREILDKISRNNFKVNMTKIGKMIGMTKKKVEEALGDPSSRVVHSGLEAFINNKRAALLAAAAPSSAPTTSSIQRLLSFYGSDAGKMPDTGLEVDYKDPKYGSGLEELGNALVDPKLLVLIDRDTASTLFKDFEEQFVAPPEEKLNTKTAFEYFKVYNILLNKAQRGSSERSLWEGINGVPPLPPLVDARATIEESIEKANRRALEIRIDGPRSPPPRADEGYGRKKKAKPKPKAKGSGKQKKRYVSLA